MDEAGMIFTVAGALVWGGFTVVFLVGAILESL